MQLGKATFTSLCKKSTPEPIRASKCTCKDNFYLFILILSGDCNSPHWWSLTSQPDLISVKGKFKKCEPLLDQLLFIVKKKVSYNSYWDIKNYQFHFGGLPFKELVGFIEVSPGSVIAISLCTVPSLILCISFAMLYFFPLSFLCQCCKGLSVLSIFSSSTVLVSLIFFVFL